MLRRHLTAVLLAAVFLAAGCGGDDKGPQTKEGFISAADGVCEDLFSEFAQAKGTEPTTPEEVAEANEQLADTYEKLGDKLGEVRLPSTGAARTQAQAFVASVRGAKRLLANLRASSQRFVDAANAADREALTKAGNDVRGALDAFRSSRADSDRLAIAYGLNFCGNLG
ncbi:MAG TPA: hypothetical protein VNA28_14555 [Solirubrobacteraceae bacterium]|nr:hypothetical protein [Solirubrobacteraceae bacterium]